MIPEDSQNESFTRQGETLTPGHNVDRVNILAGFVAPPHGADFPVAICGCRCADDPVIKAWMHTPTGRERPLREGGETAP